MQKDALVNRNVPKVGSVVVQETSCKNLLGRPADVAATAHARSQELRGILHVRVVDEIIEHSTPIGVVLIHGIVGAADSVFEVEVRLVAHLKSNEFVTNNILGDLSDLKSRSRGVVKRNACTTSENGILTVKMAKTYQ